MRKKILVITGTRAEYGLFRPTLNKIKSHQKFQLKLLVTGMHTLKKYGNTISEIKKDGFKINAIVKIPETDDMLDSLILEISGIRKYIISDKPDLVLILGDRDEALAAAIVASHLNIPVAHIHGGDITGNVTVDDKIRDVITALSDIHFPTSNESSTRIKSILGNKSKNIITLNNFAFEDVQTNILSKSELAKQYNLDIKKPWILVVMHPSPLEKTSFRKQILSLLVALKNIKAEIIGIYPNSDTGSAEFIFQMKKSKIFSKLYTSLKRILYLSFLANINILVGNSSSSVLEAPYFSTPVINIGKRQQNRRKYKYLFEVDYESNEILNLIKKIIKVKRNKQIVPLSNIKASQQIINFISKYFFNKYE